MHPRTTVSKKKGLLFFTLFCALFASFSSPASAQTSDARYDWTKAFGGAGDDWALSVEVDISGNVYIAGRFPGTIDFDPGAGVDNRTSAGVYDAFFSKYDANGNYQWTKAIGGTGDDEGLSVATDSDGNVYIVGHFENTVDFDPGAGVDNRTSAGVYDAFFSKYDASGNYQWTKAFGGTGYDWAVSVEVDISGNVYIAGDFPGTIDFDPGAGVDNRTSAGVYDAFFSKYDANGNYQWTKAFGGTNHDIPNSVATDSSGNVYISGFFQNTVDFDAGVGVDNRTSAGFWDAFVSKYDASGNYQWTKAFGGTGYDRALSVVTDSSGNVYIVGHFENTVDFDPGAGVDNRTSAGVYDAFFSKYDASGNYQWTKAFGEAGWDAAYSVATDSSGNVYIGGFFENTVDFDPGAGVDNRTSAGVYDAFFSKYDANGNYQWTKAFGGTGDEWTNSVAVDSNGNVYIGGDFENTVDFDPGAGVDTRTSAGGGDAFLSKFSTVYLDNRPIDLTLDINATIALSCDPSVTMNAIVGTGKSTIDANNQANCTVITNNSAGYALSWQASTDDLLNAQSDHFAAYTPASSTTPETWDIPNTTSAWGAKLAATSEGYNGGAGGSGYTYPGTGWGSDDSYGSGLWLNVAASEPFQFMQKATETDFDGETQSVMFGAEIGADKLQPTGTYTTQVTITATTL